MIKTTLNVLKSELSKETEMFFYSYEDISVFCSSLSRGQDPKRHLVATLGTAALGFRRGAKVRPGEALNLLFGQKTFGKTLEAQMCVGRCAPEKRRSSLKAAEGVWLR